MARVSNPLTHDQVASLADFHGPASWKAEVPAEVLTAAVTGGQSINAIVLSADIRASTILMREAVSPIVFADVITEFVDAVQGYLKGGRGWFDKFTGDGFLAYWLCHDRAPQSYIGEVSTFCNQTLTFFREIVIEDLRRNTRNFPVRVGLSIGVDGGPLNLVSVSNDLTIVGPPVVGAVRMVSAAEPYETIVNGYMGTVLYHDRCDNEAVHRISIRRLVRPTKEYPDGQEMYGISFLEPAIVTR